jgi:hypothetical protein
MHKINVIKHRSALTAARNEMAQYITKNAAENPDRSIMFQVDETRDWLITVIPYLSDVIFRFAKGGIYGHYLTGKNAVAGRIPERLGDWTKESGNIYSM